MEYDLTASLLLTISNATQEGTKLVAVMLAAACKEP